MRALAAGLAAGRALNLPGHLRHLSAVRVQFAQALDVAQRHVALAGLRVEVGKSRQDIAVIGLPRQRGIEDRDGFSGTATGVQRNGIDIGIASARRRKLRGGAQFLQPLRVALLALPARQRTAIILRYYLDMNEKEMALELDAPRGTVKWLLNAGRTRLRELLGAERFVE